MKDLFLDLMLHYGGKWIETPELVYEEKYVAARRDIASDMIDYYMIEDEYIKNLGLVALKQLLVKGPCRKLFLVEGSEGIKILQTLLNEQFNVVHTFAVDDFEEPISAPTLIHHTEAHFIECEYGTDAESETDFDDNGESNDEKYNFEKLEVIKMQQNRKVNEKLYHYKELHLSMTFKDKKEAKRVVDLYAPANKKPLRVKQSDKTRLRYIREDGCPFVILVSLDGKGPGFKVKTLIEKHTCEDAFKSLSHHHFFIPIFQG
ncbi:hypothetical protein P3S68_014726 [Capsicum galapagoense]